MVVQGSTIAHHTATTALLPTLPTLPPSSFTTTYKKRANPLSESAQKCKKITYFVINNKTQYTYSIDTILLCTLQKKITLSFKK